MNIQAPPTIHTNARGGGPARLRPFLTLLASMRTLRVVTIERKLSVSMGVSIVAAALGGSGSIPVGVISPADGEGHTQCTGCKTATALV